MQRTQIAAPRKEAGTGRNSENGHVAFGATTRHNIKVSAGDVVSVKRVEPVVLEAVKLAPVKETIGDLDEAQLAEMVNKYFANSFVADASGNPVYRPATTNNLIKLPGPSGGKQVIFQVSVSLPRTLSLALNLSLVCTLRRLTVCSLPNAPIPSPTTPPPTHHRFQSVSRVASKTGVLFALLHQASSLA